QRDELRGFEDEIPDFLGRVDVRIDWRDNADENLAAWLQVPANHPEHSFSIVFATQRHAKISDVQLEQPRQKLRVVNVCAVSGVEVSAGTGMNSDELAFFGGESGECKVVEIHEAVEELTGG